MAQILRGKISIDPRFKHIRPTGYALSRVNFSGFSYNGSGSSGGNGQRRQNFNYQEFLRGPKFGGYQYYQSSRGYAMLVELVLQGVLKLRYLVLGGAIGAWVTLNKRYEEWKDGLPDMKWLEEVKPDNEKWGQFTKNLLAVKDSVKDSIEIDPRLKQLSENKINEWREWFDKRLDNAIEAAETQQNPQIETTKKELRSKNTVNAKTLSADESRRRAETLQTQVDALQTEIMNIQL